MHKAGRDPLQKSRRESGKFGAREGARGGCVGGVAALPHNSAQAPLIEMVFSAAESLCQGVPKTSWVPH